MCILAYCTKRWNISSPFNLILSWSPSFLWPVVGRYEASGGLKTCSHVFVSLFAIGCAWESMLEDGAQEVELSCPTCLSWDHPRGVDAHTPADQRPPAWCEGASWDQKKFPAKSSLNYWPTDSWVKQMLTALSHCIFRQFVAQHCCGNG